MTDLGRALIEKLTADLGEIHDQAVEDTGRISRGLLSVWPFAAVTDQPEKPKGQIDPLVSEPANDP